MVTAGLAMLVLALAALVMVVSAPTESAPADSTTVGEEQDNKVEESVAPRRDGLYLV